MTKKILVLVPFTDEQKRELEAKAPGYEIQYVTITEGGVVTDDMIKESSAILGNLPPQRLQCAEKLEWLQLNSSGSDVYVRDGVLPKGCKLTNSTGSYGLALSEHMLALTFFMKKKLGLYLRNQEKHLWHDEGRVTAIKDSTTLVIGYGDIGENYGRRMAALGSKVYGIRRRAAACPDYMEGMGTFEQLDEWLSKADIVAMALPNSPETAKIMNAERIAKMKKGSLLVNVGRGTSIDYDALYEALKAGVIDSAAADVTDPEPLPEDHPLWDCQNFFVTPHIAGDFHLQETLDSIVATFIENLGHFVNDEEMINQVDFTTGYKKNEFRLTVT